MESDLGSVAVIQVMESKTRSFTEDRAKYTDLILQSTAAKKLIVAGPGTGKTYTFREALKAAGGRGLALTFINNLVRDLEVELAEVADAYTFHGFCKFLLHRTLVDGLTAHFRYYPPLPIIVAQDMIFLGRVGIDNNEIERCLHNLDNGQRTISEAQRIGSYYDAVAHTDSVYRVLQHLERNRDGIPDYPLVVVDEYQDFSFLETSFISLLAEKNPVLVAGDDDQALYGFKHASAKHIRALAHDSSYAKFALPYCSRCTEVIVEAVHDVLMRAQALGLLRERLPKPYTCYLPDKKEDSEQHPHIVHAHCTVERNNAPYIGRYVAARIAQIPEADIITSKKGRYPTALVIGPVEFVRRVYLELRQRFEDVVLKESPRMTIPIVDGYRYLARDETDRLGWRIVLYCDDSAGGEAYIRVALNDGAELSSLVPADFRRRHLRVAILIGKIERDEPLLEEERTIVESATVQSLDNLKMYLGLEAGLESEDDEGVSPGESLGDSSTPRIICTSLRGAKGLSASHVFIVGFNNGHFPRNPADIKDDEVCSLLVALSRTRKQCYVVSCGRFGIVQLQPSIFLEWLRTKLKHENVNAKLIQSMTGQAENR